MTDDDWSLFQDWCDATGHVALPTTWAAVQEFVADVTAAPSTIARRLSTIRARHDQARRALAGAPPRRPVPTPWRTPGDPVDPETPDGPRWLGLPDTLHHLPVYGWPHAVAGRRDAVVLVLAAAGWHRRNINALTPDRIRLEPVPAIDDVDLPMTNHGLTCPSCALTRWLRVLAATHDQRDGAWEPVVTVVEDQPADVRRHECGTPVPPGWARAPWVLPSIDRGGGVTISSQMPVRRVSAIAADRQLPPNTTATTQTPRPPQTHPDRPTPSFADRAATMHALDDILDDLDEALAATDQHWAEVMAGLDDSSAITQTQDTPDHQ